MDINYLNPVIKKNGEIKIEFYSDVNKDVCFELFQMEDENKIIGSNGNVFIYEKEKLNNTSLNIKNPGEVYDCKNFYKMALNFGMEWNEDFKCLNKVWQKNGVMVSKLMKKSNDKRNYYVNPYLLDGGFQTLAFWLFKNKNNDNGGVVLGIDSYQFISPLNQDCYCLCESVRDENEFNLQFFNEQGVFLGKLTGVKYYSSPKVKQTNSIYYKVKMVEKDAHEIKKEQNKVVVIDIKGMKNLQLNNVIFYVSGNDEEYCCDEKNITMDFNNDNHLDKLIEKLKSIKFNKLVFAENKEENYKSSLILTKVIHSININNIDFKKVIYTGYSNNPWCETVGSLFQTINLEENSARFTAILSKSEEDVTNKIGQESNFFDSGLIYYVDGKRMVNDVENITPEIKKNRIRQNGHFIISGGKGKLAQIVAKYLIENFNARITSFSRSKTSVTITRLKEQYPDNFHFVSCDCTDYNSVEEMYKTARERFKDINGIFHIAGVKNDKNFKDKKLTDFENCISVKVRGAENLDMVSKKDTIDFFCMFSSISSVWGNPGQSDYVMGNRFLDMFAKKRNDLVRNNKRCGHTISINWSLWRDGGMKIDPEIEEIILNKTGMKALTNSTGLNAIPKILNLNLDQIIIFDGEIQKIRNLLIGDTLVKTGNAYEINKNAIDFFKEIFSKESNIPVDMIDENVPIDTLGVDSLMIMSLSKRIDKVFGKVPKTVYFEYNTISELVKYFVDNYDEKLKEVSGTKTTEKSCKKQSENVSSLKENNVSNARFLTKETYNDNDNKIAIIGLDGRYPGAKTIDDYWENLRDGVDSIVEIPHTRWNNSKIYSGSERISGKTYSKWGGFIENVYKFDTMFFGISPKNAKIMDPQQRIFLEMAWHCIEDAGYSIERLHEKTNRNVGVFVGATWLEYMLHKLEEFDDIHPIAQLYHIPNRVSYHLGLTGPSIAVDTACSSSLTAIHQACSSILNNECDAALAGGVNLSLHYNKYRSLSLFNILSTDGRCRSFGDGGDGYVPGEGVGIVLLKKLDKAINDGDRIYGVVCGTSINHGGRTNGYSVPNPKAQAEVIKKTLEKAKISPTSISYVEAHGTGTMLGDLIELSGLKDVFENKNKGKQYCSIGSSKSNIGHLEAAAGIAQVTKVLLQMKNKELVPTINCDKVNSEIDFENSPFYLQKTKEYWKSDSLRRAAVSSFGAGGANAHIILEEYKNKPKIKKKEFESDILILSAKTNNQLLKYTNNLIKYLKKNNNSKFNICDVTYTFKIGRTSFPYRLAVIFKSLEELLEKLNSFLNSDKDNVNNSHILSGYCRKIDKTIEVKWNNEKIEKLLKDNELLTLGKIWIKGKSINWSKGHVSGNVISVPKYPFDKKNNYMAEKLPLIYDNKVLNEETLLCENVKVTSKKLKKVKFFDN